jgi:hypothetical protein
MNTVGKPTRPDEAARTPEEAVATVANVEGEIREFVRRDLAGAPRRPDSQGVGEPIPQNLNQLIERVAGTSIKELDQLISELTVVRDYLKAEGERVQREIANYAQVSQAAMSSAKIILDSMGQWKSTVSPQGTPPRAAERG